MNRHAKKWASWARKAKPGQMLWLWLGLALISIVATAQADTSNNMYIEKRLVIGAEYDVVRISDNYNVCYVSLAHFGNGSGISCLRKESVR